MPTDDIHAWFEKERLHFAARDGDIEEMARLIAVGSDIHRFDDLSHTPLHCAIEAGQHAAAAWLLQQGANVNANEEDRIGETALALAVQGSHPEIVELLLTHNADPDIDGWMGQTARMRAARRQDENGKRILALIYRHVPTMKHQRADGFIVKP